MAPSLFTVVRATVVISLSFVWRDFGAGEIWRCLLSACCWRILVFAFV